MWSSILLPLLWIGDTVVFDYINIIFWFLIIHKDFRRFSRIIIEKTFEEFEEICG